MQERIENAAKENEEMEGKLAKQKEGNDNLEQNVEELRKKLEQLNILKSDLAKTPIKPPQSWAAAICSGFKFILQLGAVLFFLLFVFADLECLN